MEGNCVEGCMKKGYCESFYFDEKKVTLYSFNAKVQKKSKVMMGLYRRTQLERVKYKLET